MIPLELLQWPAMAVTLAASWCVASSTASTRRIGFWLFLVSNVLWIAWGVDDGAWALVVLQVGLAALNLRGNAKAKRQEREQQAGSGSDDAGTEAAR